MKAKKRAINQKVSQEPNPIGQIIQGMPPRLKSALEQLGRDNDALCWKIADKVAELLTWTISAGIECHIMDVCTAAAIVMDTDYSAFRVYDFFLVGEKLSKPAYRKKVEPLPFNHLLFARQHSSASNGSITFLEIVNRDLELLDSNQGAPVACYQLKDDITGKNARRKKALKGAPAIEEELHPFKVEGDMNVQTTIQEIFKAVEFVEKNMRLLSAQVSTASESVLLGRAIENLARGMTLTREFLLQVVERV